MRGATAVVVVGLALAGPARADLVTVDFAGTFSSMDGDASLATGAGLNSLAGKRFAGSVRYNPAAPVTAQEFAVAGDTITAYVFGPTAQASFVVAAGGTSLAFDPVAPIPFEVAVFRGVHPGVLIRAGVLTDLGGTLPGGSYYLVLSLDDVAGKVVKDKALPTALDPGRFDATIFGVGWESGDGWVEIQGDGGPAAAAEGAPEPTALVLAGLGGPEGAPEPTALVLAGLGGLLGAGVAARRRRSAG
jgi:hypothetical protein